MVRQLFTAPDDFMERKSSLRGLQWETLIILVIGGLGAVGHAYVAWDLNTAIRMETLIFPIISYTIEPILGAFLIWVGYSLGIHLIANRVYNSRGPLSRTMKLVAWALLPIGVGNLLRSAVLYFAYADVDWEQALEDADLTSRGQGIDVVLETGMEEPVYVLAPILLIVAVLATGYLLVPAVQTAKDLSRNDARRVAGVVIGVHVLYLLLGVVDVIGMIT